MHLRNLMSLLFLAFSLLMCKPDPLPEVVPPPPAAEQIDILALGDSYTKGESVPWNRNFPNQLADSLRAEGRQLNGVSVIAQTGWRTQDLLNAVAAADTEIGDSIFSLVTLCIGVNNQYQHGSFELYKNQFETLLGIAIERAGGRKDRVIVLSIPDWSYTPYGQSFSNPALNSQEIDTYNAANQAISAQYGVAYIDVTGISRRGLAEPGLVASDGLHPSAGQYAEWVSRILPLVRTMF